MRNKNEDLRNHLFQMLEILNDDDCRPEDIERAKAMAQVAKEINSSAKNEIQFANTAGRYGRAEATVTTFLNTATKEDA